MATATSRMSLDPRPSLDLPNPHCLPNPHARVPDLAPAAHPQVRRVSSDSQAPGRASPSPRISRRTAVPFLLEAFPAPPSHIPGTPTSLTSNSLLNSPSFLASTTGWLSSASAGSAAPISPVSPSNSNAMLPCSPKSAAATLLPSSNPPPSSPPTGPLPPVPGPSSVTPDILATHRALQTVARSASPALSITESLRSQSRTEQLPRSSVDVNDPVRSRRRQGSLSSLRNPVFPTSEQSETIAEEPVEESCPPFLPSAISQSPPLSGSVAERRSHDQSRGDSPDILRSCLSRVATAPHLPSGDKAYVEDSIARVDMSDLSALKLDNEGDGDDQASRPFPRFPPLPHSQSQSPTAAPSTSPSYVHTPRKPSMSSVYSTHVPFNSEDMNSRHRAMSPEITQIISATPRPRKRSTPSRSRAPSWARNRKESSRSQRVADAAPVPKSSCIVKTPQVTKVARLSGDGGATCLAGEEQGNDSDSSLDLHTPLPQLMLRHGMLSPNSKLLPHPEVDPTRLSIMSSLSSSSYVSNLSNLSLMSTTSTSSKHRKDARDTPQRRVRHRDGKLLKGGIGLTTGLGWSDSEDEDAPSPLTRRVSSLVLTRRASSSSVASYRSSHSQPNSTQPLSRSISHSILREVDEYEHEHDADEFGYSHRASVATRSLPSRSNPVSRVGSVRSTGSSLARYSTYSTSSVTPAGIRARTGSVSESSVYAASLASKPDSSASADAHTTTGLMPGIREHDDGVTPTRAAFERSSLGSLNGSSGPDIPHTPSSTASSASLPFPATPESGAEIPHLQSAYNQDKVLPPLPPGARGKFSSTFSLRSQSGGLQRPRTYSNTSSVSNSSMLGVPSSEAKSISTSQKCTPRQSLAERPTKTAIPVGPPRPSLSGTPRPSLTIPKSPLPPQSAISGLPRPTTPSSPYANAGQGYTPRPLRLVSRSSPLPSFTSPANASSHPLPDQAELNQSSGKVLQPGEQPSRPGQVLTYNRNVHDQLKLRTHSLNTGPNRAPAPVVSPDGTQTLFMPSSGVGSGPNSALSTPVTARSQSPLPSPSPGGESMRPRPRTGTGMMYRNNLSVGSVATSRIRVPSTVSR
ncbi:hypothetical protein HD554DRAFT_609299 [Boletus coccyginus]|nr:hypothetical protein HD554DRAFT_609299 [Boletus coccyginus]